MKLSRPQGDRIGAVVTDFDGRRANDDEIAVLKQCVYEHRLVVFRDQEMTAPEYIAFASRFGKPQIYLQPNYHHPEHPEIFVSSNMTIDGKRIGVARTGYYWHTDCAFQDEPLPFTMLYPQKLPTSKRETYFINMKSVYERLSPELRSTLDGARAYHNHNGRYKIREEDVGKAMHELLDEVDALMPGAVHPAVITHGVTGERVLYVNEGFTVRFEGMSPDRSAALLAEVFAFVRREEHVEAHTYRPGDIIVWDNRVLIHKSGGAPPGEENMIYRIGIYDGHRFYR